MENATSSPEYPPDAGTWELSAVIYVAVCLFVLFVIHGSMERRGRMKWSKLRWEHVAESSRGCSTSCMAVWRFFCCVLVILNNVVMVFVSDSASKLVAGGFIVFATFTVWSWTLIGVYMGLAGAVSLASACKSTPRQGCASVLPCRIIWLLFEVMLPVSFLIFLLVWLVLLPAAYHTSGTAMGLFTPPALAAHNLNFVFMFIEALVNRLCITTYHLIFIFYYGGLYVIFSWIFFAFQHFFFYFFIDWRYPLVLIGYSGLLCMLTTFFFIGRSIVNCVKPPLYTWDLDESESEESELESASCTE
ncbi:unnamed protein product [Durusdinium trenchii]|uniref:Transmembrane protein n=2 Tax=Durusdinium trenchii TaxID=1381693 RepID=A0ABP0HX36_9DINO